MHRCLLVVIAATIGLSAGCHRGPQPGGASGARAEQARRQAESLAANAVTGGAEAQARAIPGLAVKQRSGWLTRAFALIPEVVVAHAGAKPEPPVLTPPATQPVSAPMTLAEEAMSKAQPRPGAPPVIRECIVSLIPNSNEVEAEEEAINSAREVLTRRLAELDPPVHYRPSANEVKNEFLRRESRSFRRLKESELEPYKDHVKPEMLARLSNVGFVVEVTPDQVRQLRTRDRVWDMLRVFGGLTATVLAAFLFFRLDEWTKGYLTRWLAFGAVLLAGGAVAALYFV